MLLTDKPRISVKAKEAINKLVPDKQIDPTASREEGFFMPTNLQDIADNLDFNVNV